jgi:hypothetical protein
VTALNTAAVTGPNRVRATDDVAERISGMITRNRMEAGGTLPSEQALVSAQVAGPAQCGSTWWC